MMRPILIALGGNLPFNGRPVLETFEMTLQFLIQREIQVVRRSRWYRSAPVPVSNQPDFINGVVSIRTRLAPESLLSLLHDAEARAGRVRQKRNEARTLDLDLLDYRSRISGQRAAGPLLPHPRLTSRAFVLFPLRDVALDWKHPVTGHSVAQLIEQLPEPYGVEPL